MNPILKNVIAVIAGGLVGMIVNGGLVEIGPSIIPLPEGADVSSIPAFAKSMDLFSPKHFLFPFLAHALGALLGAFTAAKIAANNKMKFAIAIGVFFLIGGSTMVYLVGGPLWFIALDLIVAYIPMGWLGGKLAGANKLA